MVFFFLIITVRCKGIESERGMKELRETKHSITLKKEKMWKNKLVAK